MAYDGLFRCRLQHRLVAVLRERLAELEDDAIREANSRRTSWDTITGLECSACHRSVFHQLVEGRCRSCARKKSDKASELARRLYHLRRRYPGLVSGLRKKLLSLRG